MTLRIAYFSGKGHTEKVATALACLLDAELVRIEPLRESGMPGKLLKTLFFMKSAIKPCPTDLTGIDGLIIALPVWRPKSRRTERVPCRSERRRGTTLPRDRGDGREGVGRYDCAVRTELERKGMRFASSATTIERDVDSGTFMATVEAFAAGIRRK